MARVSRKKSQTQEVAKVKVKAYQVGIYCRLSIEDGGHKERDTMANQIAICKKFLENYTDLELIEVYEENGFTGTTFERPVFQRMLTDLKSGKINCVVVKDLSRLGRNSLDTTDYVTRIFPEMQIRFLVAADRYDSEADDADQSQLMIMIDNLLNELYAKRLSKKLVQLKTSQRKNGEFIGGYAPYGYKKCEDNHNKLELDEPTALVVRMIYEWRAKGEGYSTIYNRLNQMQIPSPGYYRYLNGIITNKNKDGKAILWGRHMLKIILSNPTYLGNLVQGKYRAALYKNQRCHEVDSSEWVITENAMEPVVSKELYELVQAVNEDSAQRYKKQYGNNAHLPKAAGQDLYPGLIYCSDCGNRMRIVRSLNKEKTKAYFLYKCGRFIQVGKHGCTSHRIHKHVVDEAVLATIQKQMELFIDVRDLMESRNSTSESAVLKQNISRRIASLDNSIHKTEDYLFMLYEDFKDELLSAEEYGVLKKESDEKIQEMKKDIIRLQKIKERREKGYADSTNLGKLHKKYPELSEVTKEVAEAFVEKIVIYDENRIEITLKYADEIKNLFEEYVNSGEEVRVS